MWQKAILCFSGQRTTSRSATRKSKWNSSAFNKPVWQTQGQYFVNISGRKLFILRITWENCIFCILQEVIVDDTQADISQEVHTDDTHADSSDSQNVSSYLRDKLLLLFVCLFYHVRPERHYTNQSYYPTNKRRKLCPSVRLSVYVFLLSHAPNPCEIAYGHWG